MTKRVIIKEGDVFEVKLEDNTKVYFQYLMKDITQLNSEVIRVFNHIGNEDEEINLRDVVNSNIKFHAHVMIKLGLKLNIWTRIGNIRLESDFNAPYFRDSLDYGNPDIEVSDNWFVWKVNQNFKQVGILNETQQNYDIGIVITPFDLIDKITTGNYQFVYPRHK